MVRFSARMWARIQARVRIWISRGSYLWNLVFHWGVRIYLPTATLVGFYCLFGHETRCFNKSFKKCLHYVHESMSYIAADWNKSFLCFLSQLWTYSTFLFGQVGVQFLPNSLNWKFEILLIALIIWHLLTTVQLVSCRYIHYVLIVQNIQNCLESKRFFSNLCKTIDQKLNTAIKPHFKYINKRKRRCSEVFKAMMDNYMSLHWHVVGMSFWRH